MNLVESTMYMYTAYYIHLHILVYPNAQLSVRVFPFAGHPDQLHRRLVQVACGLLGDRSTGRVEEGGDSGATNSENIA